MKRPQSFRNFTECVTWLKKSVYMIVRGREFPCQEGTELLWTTLGTGFVAAPNRLLTAAHVISDPNKDESFQHKEKDKYYIIRHDDEDKFHLRIFEPKIDKELFIYPDIDLGVIYLDDEFYKKDDKIYANPDDFIRISKDLLPIGEDVGVLGYPLCVLQFNDRNFKQPKIGDIFMRVDKGVINCRYHTSPTTFLYEFTMAFNPGNSGGPIFDPRTGRVIAIVRGYRTFRIYEKEIIIPEKGMKLLKTYKETAYIETLNTTYSVGFATPTFSEVFKKHNIAN